MTITVNNSGGAPLVFTSIAIATGANPGDFALDPTGTTCSVQVPVPAAGSCILSVIFTPAASGARAATLTLADNANPATQLIPLVGTGGPIAPGDFTITTPNKPIIITPGQSTTIVITITPGPGIQNPITFNVPGPLPTGLCVFYPVPNSVTVTAAQDIMFHVTTTPNLSGVGQGSVTGIRPPTLLQPRAPVSPLLTPLLALFLALFLTLSFALLGYKRHASAHLTAAFAAFTPRRWAVLAATSLLLLATISFAGCGGSGSNNTPLTINSTPPGVYQITITATAGSVSHSINATIQVQ